MLRAVRGFWKRSAESVTALWGKYRTDPFFHGEVSIIVMQAVFALAILALVGLSFVVIDTQVADAIAQSMRTMDVATPPDTLALSIIGKMRMVRTQNFAGIVSMVLLATIVLGYVVARVALAPTRDTLAAQKRFIGNIAHELRTPLSILKTNTEIALLDRALAPEMREMLISNVEELDRIAAIINNLLSLSTLVRPERLEFETVDLGQVVSETVAMYANLAKTSGQEVTFRRSPGAFVWGNETALRQVAANLIKNALNYTARGGSITVTVSHAQGGMVELLVQDSGIGIERHDLFRIFEPFYRADPSRKRGNGGTGLGLAIVSELVKLHQGKITVRSAIGRGTVVSVLLPASRLDTTLRASAKDEKDSNTMHEIAVDFSA